MHGKIQQHLDSGAYQTGDPNGESNLHSNLWVAIWEGNNFHHHCWTVVWWWSLGRAGDQLQQLLKIPWGKAKQLPLLTSCCLTPSSFSVSLYMSRCYSLFREVASNYRALFIGWFEGVKIYSQRDRANVFLSFIEEIYYVVITVKNGFVRVLLSVIVLFVLYKFKLFTSSKSLLALQSALSLVINYLIIFSLRIWTIMSSLNIRLDKGLSHNYFI